MAFIIILLLAVVLLTALVATRRDRFQIAFNAMKETSSAAVSRLIFETCRRKTEESGRGIDPTVLIGSINRARKAVAAKDKKNLPVSEAEKWLYENYFLIYRYVYGQKNDLGKLPHIDNIPRIVTIAKIIVNNSLDGLSAEKIKDIMENISPSLHLKFAEIREFNNALKYALTEQAYILSKRILNHGRMELAAKDGILHESLLSSDVYVFYRILNDKISEKERNFLASKGFDRQKAILNYNNLNLFNAQTAKTIFTALSNCDDFMPIHIGLKYSAGYAELKKGSGLDEVSVPTLTAYMISVEKCAKKTGTEESYVAEKAVELSKKLDIDVSILLLDNLDNLVKFIKTGYVAPINKNKQINAQRLYVAFLTVVSVAGSVLTAIYLDIVMGVLAFIPYFFIVENVTNYLLSHILPERQTPRMNYKNIPYNHSVTVVVAQFISSPEQFENAMRHIEETELSNGGNNVNVALLADVNGTENEYGDLDREIDEYIAKSDFNENINIFIRKRTSVNGKYIGKERKRGAINALNKMLVTGNREDFRYIHRDPIATTYVVALDEDNVLLPGEVREMVNMMAHPYNEQYDLLSCHSRYNLFSFKTLYSERFCEESGTEFYPDYSGLYYRAFRRDIYCGKGIYRLKNFYAALENVFPSQKILSHDILEGSVLKTGAGTTILEDVPVGFIPDRERRKRWQRGDLQLLPFVSGRWKNDDGEKYRTKIEPLYKFIMAKNILSLLKEPCLFALLIFGLIKSSILLIFGISLFFLPYVVNEIKILRGFSDRILPIYIFNSSIRNFFFAIEDFLTLGYYAFENIWVIATTFFRMVRGKKLLEWKTYFDSQKKSSLSDYARAFCFPFAAMSVVAVAMSFFYFKAVYIGIYALATLLAYAELGFTSGCYFKKRGLSEPKREKLSEYAKRTYKYFDFMTKEGGIIPDNLQLKPYKGKSETTSPTNIGFSLVARVCACKLGIITVEEAISEMNHILDEVGNLRKWRGNLYNWYDIRTKKPVNEFVSSVDSGNFLACLVLAKEFFKENFDPVGELKAELTLKNTDLSALYDKNKKLFYLGYDGEKYVGHYDLLNSESRLLSTIYTAYYGDDEHYKALQRDFNSTGGNTLLSWSGTMFETMMPNILLEPPRHSMLSRTIKNTVEIQSGNSVNGVWGISESGYYKFDENLKYQYYAFGLNELSLRNDKTSYIISPYSSAMCIDIRPNLVMENLERLDKMGLYGEYGFYESIDMAGKKRVVSSYMSHHQGMFLCSITNFLCDDYLRNLFKNDKKVSSVLSIFNETAPKNTFYVKSKERIKNLTENRIDYSKNYNKIEQYFQVSGLIDSDYRLFGNGFGGGFSAKSEIFINKFSPIYSENFGNFFFVKEKNNWYSPTFLPFKTDFESYSFGYTDREIFHTNEKKSISQSVILIPGLNGEVRKLTVKNKGEEVSFYSSVCLNTLDGFRSHPAYNGLFVETFADGNILLVMKRAHEAGGRDFCVGVRVEGVSEMKWESNEMNYIGRCGTLSNPLFLDENNVLDKKHYPSVGDVLHPCIAFTGVMTGCECQVAILFSEDMKSLYDSLRSLPDDMYSSALLSPIHSSLNCFTNELLGEILYLPYAQKTLNSVKNSAKRENFASLTRLKKLIVYKYRNGYESCFENFLSVISDFVTLRLDVSFVIMASEETRDYVVNDIKKKIALFSGDLCHFSFENEEILSYAFIVVNPDLTFAKTKFIDGNILSGNLADNSSVNEKLNPDAVLFRSGNGGFDGNDAYVISDDKPPFLPYSNVIALKYGGMIDTENGGGYFYFDNSRENKMSRFENDCVSDCASEIITVESIAGKHRINGGSASDKLTVFDRGSTVYVCKRNGILSTVKNYMLCDGRARGINIDILNETGGIVDIFYSFYPSLDWTYDPTFITFEQKGEVLVIDNLKTDGTLYVKAIVDNPERLTVPTERRFNPSLEYYIDGEREKITLIFTQDMELARTLNKNNVELAAEKEEFYFKNLSDIEISSSTRSFNIIARILPYQIASARLNGKLGFYQVSGATGFRDQLQDCAAFLHSDPGRVRRQITESARHQYVEGDVMHWWHNPKFGLRSKISDDKLFLPLICAEYIAYTNDYSILEEEIPYLDSPTLRSDEKTRYENPPYTDYTESLFKHCLKAIKSALKYGEHGLLVMGTGDWNDGMDYVCKEGKGESVFVSMLCYEVMRKFSAFCPEDIKRDLLRLAEELKTSINAFSFEKDRYKRLYSDDGRWLGSANGDKPKLDLLVQSYAVISGVADEKTAEKALNTARELIDRDAGIIKLLDPPLDKRDYLGYISAYPSGVRENGGQYTHAAMWYLIALTKIGRQDEAFELFQMINPVEKCRDERKNAMYKGEPYVFSGDVYSNADNYGRMGWSWYTGSAAWAYRLIVEEFYGLKREGRKLIIEPHLPKALHGSVISYRYSDSVYVIEYRIDEENRLEIAGETLGENSIILESGKREKISVACKSSLRAGFTPN